MNIEIVSIGNELLAGDVVDTNASHLAQSVARVGLRVHRSQTVPDVISAIVDALALAAERSDVVVVSGGLGPTTDDLTTEAAAQLAGLELELHQPSLDRIIERFRARGLPFKKNNEKQAWFPKGAEVLGNPVGTAPGFLLTMGPVRMFFLPGVHREYVAMIDSTVLPRLASEARGDVRWRTLRTFGMTESAVGDALSDIALDEGLFIQYRASFPEILVTPVVRGVDAGAATERLEAVCAAVRTRLGIHVYGEGADSFPAVVGALLRERGLTLAAAESCTGGRLSQLFTGVPGSSDFFHLGAVTYSNEAKEAVLGVQHETLMAHGAVSEQVAREMVQGVVRAGSATVGIAITGIAGPGGGTEDKPVGTIHFALSVRGRVSHVQHHFAGDRRWIQTISAWWGLDLVRRALVDPT